MNVALRVPGWCENVRMTLSGEEVLLPVQDGYVTMALESGIHLLHMDLELAVRRVYANAAVRADTGCVALQRGPVVYCLEGVDNGDTLCALRLPRDARITARTAEDGALQGMTVLEMEGQRACSQGLYSTRPPQLAPQRLTAIPYFAWGNRGLNEMRVWIPE